MFDTLRLFLAKKRTVKKINIVYTEEYREGFNRLWSESIRDYVP